MKGTSRKTRTKKTPPFSSKNFKAPLTLIKWFAASLYKNRSLPTTNVPNKQNNSPFWRSMYIITLKFPSRKNIKGNWSWLFFHSMIFTQAKVERGSEIFILKGEFEKWKYFFPASAIPTQKGTPLGNELKTFSELDLSAQKSAQNSKNLQGAFQGNCNGSLRKTKRNLEKIVR